MESTQNLATSAEAEPIKTFAAAH
ncbi:hypothetical protein BN873_1080001 [Candidatus Competibacter denitrificans Run_A_D11]|uniref:Uncharacterized protein n=1 Tax=Candidatus Competibacter denitrificans Run_A_D11 TaxID=1400863 RepID=W6M150_9GAMM|nr:hypothetical protein BN873_1080001 [Candidatus Competibacter denitrificans Run_A_D11]